MTSLPEAKLARKAELCYATIAMVTDFDCWRGGTTGVPEMLAVNIGKVQQLLARVMRNLPRGHVAYPIGSDRALETALIMASANRDPVLLAKLDAVAGRVL